MAGCEDAEQIEEAYQRDISGRDHQYATRCRHGYGVAGEPCGQGLRLQHVPGDGRGRAADILGREPRIGSAGVADRVVRPGIVAEVVQPLAEGGKEGNGVLHHRKDTLSQTICCDFSL